MTDAARAACEACLKGSHDGSLTFPQILGLLAGAGVEGYAVDFRGATTTYYLATGEALILDTESDGEPVALPFNAAAVEAAVRQSQAGEHTYRDFCRKVKGAGCSGYIVSMPGRRVTYFGRTAETHVEHFPS